MDQIFTPGFQLDRSVAAQISSPTTSLDYSLVALENGEMVNVVDVGGRKHFQEEWNLVLQRARENKSEKCLCAICYVVSLEDFRFKDDKSKINRLDQSLETWKNLLHNELADDIPLILIFNKLDTFSEGPPPPPHPAHSCRFAESSFPSVIMSLCISHPIPAVRRTPVFGSVSLESALKDISVIEPHTPQSTPLPSSYMHAPLTHHIYYQLVIVSVLCLLFPPAVSR